MSNHRGGLSPDEVAVLALDRNPGLRAFRARRGIAQAELLSAGILPNPRLDSRAAAPAGGPDANRFGYGVGVYWDVAPLLGSAARIRAARQGLVSVDLDVAWREWQVAQGARLAAISAVYIDRRLAVVSAAVGVSQDRLDRCRQARRALANTKLELARAERSLADWQLRGTDLRRRRGIARARVARLLGVDPGVLPPMRASWQPCAVRPPTSELLVGIAKRRLDLVALDHAGRSRDAAVAAAAVTRFAAIELGARAGQEVDGVRSVGLALRIDLPLLNPHLAERARARAQGKRIKAEYAARRATARVDVIRFADELAILRAEQKTAITAAAAATRLSHLLRSSFRAGILTVLTAADAEDRAFSARLRQIDIDERIARADVALVIASGSARCSTPSSLPSSNRGVSP